LEPTREVIHRLFHELIVTAPSLGAGLDWKTSLQELSAAEGLGLPVYEVTEDGPDHAKTFAAVVLVGGQARGTGVGRTKKEAEQQAAATAYNSIKDGSDDTAADDAAADDTAADDTAADVAAADVAAADDAAADDAAADDAAADQPSD
jgi:ribonuclease-3